MRLMPSRAKKATKPLNSRSAAAGGRQRRAVMPAALQRAPAPGQLAADQLLVDRGASPTRHDRGALRRRGRAERTTFGGGVGRSRDRRTPKEGVVYQVRRRLLEPTARRPGCGF